MHPFRAAVEAGDFESMPALFAEDVVFRSPIAHKPYEGRDTLAVILRAVSKVFEDLRYVREIGGAEDAEHALVFTANVGVDRHRNLGDLAVKPGRIPAPLSNTGLATKGPHSNSGQKEAVRAAAPSRRGDYVPPHPTIRVRDPSR